MFPLVGDRRRPSSGICGVTRSRSGLTRIHRGSARLFSSRSGSLSRRTRKLAGSSGRLGRLPQLFKLLPHSFRDAAKPLTVLAVDLVRYTLQLGGNALVLSGESVLVASYSGRFRRDSEYFSGFPVALRLLRDVCARRLCVDAIDLSGFPLTFPLFTGLYPRRLGADASGLSGFPLPLRAFSLPFSAHSRHYCAAR